MTLPGHYAQRSLTALFFALVCSTAAAQVPVVEPLPPRQPPPAPPGAPATLVDLPPRPGRAPTAPPASNNPPLTPNYAAPPVTYTQQPAANYAAPPVANNRPPVGNQAPPGNVYAPGGNYAPRAPTAPPVVATDESKPFAGPAAPPIVTPPSAQAVAAVTVPAADLRPVTFHGVALGVATTDSVQRIWGAPTRVMRQGNAVQHTYNVAPFERVEVSFLNGRALSMTIYLGQVFEPDVLAQQFQLLKLEAVDVTDEKGNPVGLAYPERGVSLALATGVAGRQVARIVLDCIDAEPFVLRGEARLATNLTGALEDLQTALHMEPTHQQAMVLYCTALQRVGRMSDSLEVSGKGLAAAPDCVPLYLLHAKAQAHLNQYQPALNSIQQALAKAVQQPELQAQGLVLFADVIAAGPKHDYPLALDYRMQAIQRAEGVLNDPRLAARRIAHDALLDAHLGAARDIAHGSWKNKAETVTRWLERSAQLAAQGASPAEIMANRTRYARAALTACVELQGQIDPQPWAEIISKDGRLQLAAVRDPLLRHRLSLEQGLAMNDAMHAWQLRGDRDAALRAGGVSIACLEEAIPQTGAAGEELAALARSYFRIGSIHALADNDHAQAVTWYDRASEQFRLAGDAATPEETVGQGEALVSMAVSYWSVGQQQRAETLTANGVKLIEEVVADGHADRHVLAVPYANLATIHRALGHEESARNYSEMATKSRTATVR